MPEKKNIQVVRKPVEIRAIAEGIVNSGRKIGLVPTMGYLHEGHLSLMKLLDGKCDVKIASIFVNPLQFGKNEDLSTYPRDEKRDLEQLEKAGCQIVFTPEPEDMYPPDFQTYVDVEKITLGLCGEYRPGHFRGVTTIVTRLFNITRCSVAVFGLKDFQQAKVIHRMVKDLFMPVELVFGATVRESDGLAMSSRNSKLSPGERQSALSLSRSLEWARQCTENNIVEVSEIVDGVSKIISSEPDAVIQYIECVDAETLEKVERITSRAQLVLAVYVGKTRLIDNLTIGKDAGTQPIAGVI